MRALLLDEINSDRMDDIRSWLADNCVASSIDDLYWVELSQTCLTEIQAEHTDCQSHRFAVEAGRDFVKIELFIRPAMGLRCHCAGYADMVQQQTILAWADQMIVDLDLAT